MFWLFWAARTPAEKRLETAIFGMTSALVFSPLLFEATVRFHAVSNWTAAALLFAFAVFGLLVSWRKDLLLVATIAVLTGIGTGAALLVTTYDALPFTFVFLGIAGAVEVSACLDHWLGERWLTAIVADLSVLLATWLVTNERGLPEGYTSIPRGALLGAQMTLLAIYLSSTIVRTLFRGFTFGGFETAQCVLVFLTGLGGGLRLADQDARVAPALGILTLAFAAACYLVSFHRLDGAEQHGRNFYTYSTFAILLTIAGSGILLSGMPLAAAWGALAIAGSAIPRLTAQIHGGLYLLLALGVSGALQQSAELLLGSRAWSGGEPWALAVGATTAGICYLFRAHNGEWAGHSLRMAKAASVLLLSAGILAGLLTFGYHAIFGAEASHDYCATLRTAVIVAVELVLAWRGTNPVFVYPVMLLGGWRLVTIDLQQDGKPALMLSLLVYGAALMLLPRMLRTRGPSTASES
jgi:hypothetical protein